MSEQRIEAWPRAPEKGNYSGWPRKRRKWKRKATVGKADIGEKKKYGRNHHHKKKKPPQRVFSLKKKKSKRGGKLEGGGVTLKGGGHLRDGIEWKKTDIFEKKKKEMVKAGGEKFSPGNI